MTTRNNIAVQTLNVRLHYLVIVTWKLANDAIKQLDRQTVFSPPLSIIEGLFVHEVNSRVVDVLCTAVVAIAVV